MVDMRSSIIVMRKIKDKLHIVLRWRQLEIKRLGEHVDSMVDVSFRLGMIVRNA